VLTCIVNVACFSDLFEHQLACQRRNLVLNVLFQALEDFAAMNDSDITSDDVCTSSYFTGVCHALCNLTITSAAYTQLEAKESLFLSLMDKVVKFDINYNTNSNNNNSSSNGTSNNNNNNNNSSSNGTSNTTEALNILCCLATTFHYRNRNSQNNSPTEKAVVAADDARPTVYCNVLARASQNYTQSRQFNQISQCSRAHLIHLCLLGQASDACAAYPDPLRLVKLAKSLLADLTVRLSEHLQAENTDPDTKTDSDELVPTSDIIDAMIDAARAAANALTVSTTCMQAVLEQETRKHKSYKLTKKVLDDLEDFTVLSEFEAVVSRLVASTATTCSSTTNFSTNAMHQVEEARSALKNLQKSTEYHVWVAGTTIDDYKLRVNDLEHQVQELQSRCSYADQVFREYKSSIENYAELHAKLQQEVQELQVRCSQAEEYKHKHDMMADQMQRVHQSVAACLASPLLS
jgi:exonuclease VII small subunit